MDEPRGRVAVIWLAVVGALFTLAYWLVWFFVNRDWLASAHSQSYFAFENAFPMADGWMALCLTLAAVELWRRREEALLWLLLGGSAALYLGGMDVLFDLENGIYRSGEPGGVVVEALINVFCLVGGTVAVVYGWTNRRYFQSLGR
ncbi:MAG: hypothetical protein ACYCWW_20640 [Deltaproteobacteria bacterium]